MTAAPLTQSKNTPQPITADPLPDEEGGLPPTLAQTGLNKTTLGLLIALFVGIYAQTFYFMAGRWMTDPSATHGWLIIPIAIWVTMGKRDKLATLPLRSNVKGLWVMGFALLLHLIEIFFDINGPSPLSIPIFIAGGVWYFAGSAWLKELAFPIAYLLFMLPIPGALNQMVSQPLRQLAHGGAKAIVERLGIPIAGAGMNMEFWRPGSDHTNIDRDFVSLLIADPCSGLHSLMAIKALHAITAYKSRLTLGWKWALFMMALPISLAANVCRLVLIILVSAYVSKKFGLDAFHHWSPYILFIFVFMILISIGRLMEWAMAKYPKASVIVGSVLGALIATGLCGYIFARFGEAIFLNFALAVGGLAAIVFAVFKGGLYLMTGDQRVTPRYLSVVPMLALTLAGTAYFKLRPEPVVGSADVHQIPLALGEWKCAHEYPPNKAVEAELKSDSSVMRIYQNLRTGQTVQLYMIYRRYGRREFNHNPDQCFPAGGYIQMSREIGTLPYAGEDRRVVTMRFDGGKVEQGNGKEGVPNATVSYFFASGAKTEYQFMRQQLWMALERLIPNKNGWTLVRLMTDWRTNDIDAFQAQQEFMQTFGPEIQRVITTDASASEPPAPSLPAQNSAPATGPFGS